MMIEQIIAIAVFILALVLVITEKIHRSAVMILAVTILIVSGILSINKAIYYIDFETLLLLAGMMIIVEILKDLGLFHYIAIKMAKQAGNYRRFFVLMCLTTGLLSPFLDSVTVVLIFSTITVTVCKIIKKDPRPLLLSQVFCSNIGGNATLIGEPTNIMVATHAGFTFIDFIKALAPATLINLLICLLILPKFFKLEESALDLLQELDETSFIKDYLALRKAVAVFLLTILLFFIHNLVYLSPASVALLGACLMLIVIKTDVTTLLSKLEWSTLIFIGGFFIVVGGLSETGVTHVIAKSLLNLPFKGLLLVTLIGFISAIGSGMMDNVPLVAVLIPIIDELSRSLNSSVLWWTLLVGANFGGNLTPIAASPNVVAIAISEREGNPISFKKFVEIGIPIGILTTFIALLIVLVMHLIGVI